ncbi:hypothetical protein THAOC_26502, partial [Thalassiosira oceanica]
ATDEPPWAPWAHHARARQEDPEPSASSASPMPPTPPTIHFHGDGDIERPDFQRKATAGLSPCGPGWPPRAARTSPGGSGGGTSWCLFPSCTLATCLLCRGLSEVNHETPGRCKASKKAKVRRVSVKTKATVDRRRSEDPCHDYDERVASVFSKDFGRHRATWLFRGTN